MIFRPQIGIPHGALYGGGGGAPAPDPMTGGYLASYDNSIGYVNSHDLGTRDIGTAASNRYVVAVFTGQTNESGASPTTGSMTIGGNAATKLAESTGDLISGLFGAYVGIFMLNVPTGTTAAFAATTDFDVGQQYLAVYSFYGSGVTLLDSVSPSGDAVSGALDLSLNTANGGAVVGARFSFNHGAALDFDWIGLTEDFEVGVFGDQHQRGWAGDLIATGASPRTVSVEAPALGSGNSYAAAAVSLQPT